MSKTKLCPNCLTGARSNLLDKGSEACPYIYCNDGEKCTRYIPINAKYEDIWDDQETSNN